MVTETLEVYVNGAPGNRVLNHTFVEAPDTTEANCRTKVQDDKPKLKNFMKEIKLSLGSLDLSCGDEKGLFLVWSLFI